MSELSILEMLNDYPMAGALMLGMLLVIKQIISSWKGGGNVTRIEKETNKFARQTSETVNRCSERTGEVMDATGDVIRSIEKHLAQNDFGHLRTELNGAVQMLEKMANHKDIHHSELERLGSVCRDIAADIKRTDSRVVHADILHHVQQLESVAEDIKRIVIGIASK